MRGANSINSVDREIRRRIEANPPLNPETSRPKNVLPITGVAVIALTERLGSTEQQPARQMTGRQLFRQRLDHIDPR